MPLRISSGRYASSRGFSFVELLFAIAVLGIGFIMLAAIFPVGLQQTKLTIDETAAAGNARAMMSRLTQLSNAQIAYGVGINDSRSLFPHTFAQAAATTPIVGRHYNGQVRTLNDPRAFADGMVGVPASIRQFNMWRAISNELVQPADNRLATTFLFKRDVDGVTSPTGPILVPSSTAQIIAINAQVANRSTFELSDVFRLGSTVTPAQPKMGIYNLEPRPVAVQIYRDAVAGTYVATFFSVVSLNGPGVYTRGGYPTGNDPAGQPWNNVLNAALGSVVEGAFVVISDDRVIAPAALAGRLNGRIFKLGNRREDLSDGTNSPPNFVSFDLAPGYEFEIDPGQDGAFFSGTLPKDDITAIGLDKNDTSTASGVGYTLAAASDLVTVAGSSGGHGAVALVLGRGFATSVNGVTPATVDGYVGPALDIAAYTTFIPVSNP